MGEFNFQPIRFNNFGTLGFYPTYAQFSLFSTNLLTNTLYSEQKISNFVNVGGQLNVEFVLFNYLKTTWSVGYAHIFYTGTERNRGEWMFSIKLF